MKQPKFKIGDIVNMEVPDYVGYLECEIVEYFPKRNSYKLEFYCSESQLSEPYREE